YAFGARLPPFFLSPRPPGEIPPPPPREPPGAPPLARREAPAAPPPRAAAGPPPDLSRASPQPLRWPNPEAPPERAGEPLRTASAHRRAGPPRVRPTRRSFRSRDAPGRRMIAMAATRRRGPRASGRERALRPSASRPIIKETGRAVSPRLLALDERLLEYGERLVVEEGEENALDRLRLRRERASRRNRDRCRLRDREPVYARRDRRQGDRLRADLLRPGEGRENG